MRRVLGLVAAAAVLSTTVPVEASTPASPRHQVPIVDLRVSNAAAPGAPEAVREVRSDNAAATVLRARRMADHLESMSATTRTAAPRRRGTAPMLFSPPSSVISGVTSWTGVIERNDEWYVTVAQTSSGWRVFRSDDGTTWTDAAIPSGFANKATVDDDGNVYVAKASVTSAGYNVNLDIARWDGSSWTTPLTTGTCGVQWTNSESVAAVMSSGDYIAVISETRRCLTWSTNGGSTWSSAYQLTGGDIYLLQNEILMWLNCGTTYETAFTFGRFDLSTQATNVDTSLVAGCTDPVLLAPNDTDLVLASRRRHDLFSGYGRATVMFASSDRGESWEEVTLSEPLPRALSEGVDPSTWGGHSDTVVYGAGDDEVIATGVGTSGSSTAVSRVARSLKTDSDWNPQLPYDPGAWMGDTSRYLVEIAGTPRLRVARNLYETGSVDGLVLSSGALYALTGSASTVSAGATPVARNGSTIDLTQDEVYRTATSHSGAWNVFESFPGGGSWWRLYRVAPDGTVEDLGVPPEWWLGENLVISDTGAVMLISNRKQYNFATSVGSSMATAFYFTDQWYGPVPIGFHAGGAVTSNEVLTPGVPAVNIVSSYDGKLMNSTDFGMTWTKAGSGAGTPTVVPTFTSSTVWAEPYMYTLSSSGTALLRWKTSLDQYAQGGFPSGFTASRLLISPSGDLYALGTAGSASLRVLKSTDQAASWTTVVSAVTVPTSTVANLTFNFNAAGTLFAYRSQGCSAGTFINRWPLDLGTGSFGAGETMSWNPSGYTIATQDAVLIPDRPSGAVDEWQMAFAPSQVIAGPGALTLGTAFNTPQSALGISGYAPSLGTVTAPLGNFTWQVSDFSIPTAGGSLDLVRTFNGQNPNVGMFGRGWSSTYELKAITHCGTNAVSISNADGRLETFTPNGSGGYTAPKGYTSTLTLVSGEYRLTSTNGTVHKFNSSTGRLTSIVDAAGRTTNLTYDGSGKLTTVADAVTGRSLTFTYTGSVVTQTSTTAVTQGGSTAALIVRYGYVSNQLERSCAATNPSLTTGHCTLYTMSSNRLTAVVDPNGHNDVTVTYDNAGRVSWQENGATDRTTFTYTSPTETLATDELGNETITVVDDQRRPTTITDPAGGESVYAYDSNGFQISRTTPLGHTASATYDSRGNLLTRTDETGNVTRFSYDSNDNPTTIRGPRSSSPSDPTYATTVTWDATRHLATDVTDPAVGGSTASTTVTYTTGSESAVGGGVMPAYLRRVTTLPTGETTTYDYDNKGNLRVLHLPDGATRTFTYDELGRPLTQTDAWSGGPSGVTTTFTYDSASRMITQTDPAVVDPISTETHQLKAEYTYDPAGNLTAVTRSDVGGSAHPDASRQTTYTFDNADRTTSTTITGAGTSTTTYDAAGHPTVQTDELGRSIETVYNSRGLATERIALENTTYGPATDLTIWSGTYDADGRLITETDAGGQVIEHTYDDAGRLTTSTALDLAVNGDPADDIVLLEYTYDADGNITATSTGDGLRDETFTYDARGRLSNHTLDPTGLNRVTTTTYDATGRPLTTAITQDGRTETQRFTYNSTGRVATSQVENGTVDLTTSYTYDQRGLLLTITDPRGNVSGATPADYTTTNTYDVLGRLSTVTAPPVGVSATGGTPSTQQPVSTSSYTTFGEVRVQRDPRSNTTTFTYNQAGRRTQIAYPAYTTPGSTTLNPTDTFTYDAAGNITSATNRRGYTTVTAVDFGNRPLTDTAADGTAVEATTTYSYDAKGQLIESVDPIGATTEFAYDGLGRLITRTQIVRQPSGPALEHDWTYEHDLLGNTTAVHSPESLLIDAAAGAIAGGFGSVASRIPGSGTLTRGLLQAGGEVIGGGAATFVAGILSGQSPGEAWRAARDPHNAVFNASVGFATGVLTSRTGHGSDSVKGLDERVGQVGGNAANPPQLPARMTATSSVDDFLGAACRSNSFDGSTEVLLADGTVKPIEDVDVGDFVRALDPQTGERGNRRVTDVITGEGEKDLVEVTVAGEDGQRHSIVATARHPFWLTGRGGRWTDAADLVAGDRLIDADGSTHEVVRTFRFSAEKRVHNLTVEDLHTYFVVAGDTSMLVHNCGNLDALSASGGLAGKGDLTKAGHSLTKHQSGARPGNSLFPAATGSPSQINATAQGILEDILTAPGSVVVPKTSGNFAGGFEVIAPDGRKAVFDADSVFQYFGE